MRTDVKLNPEYPEFFATDLPNPSIETLEDFAEAYSWWADTSGVMEWVEGAQMRIVASDLKKRVKESISHGFYTGRPRFVSHRLAKKLRVEPSPFPEDEFTWLTGSVSSAFARLAYIQGSSEYASSQQQRDLMMQGHVPPILERYIRATIIEEGEHGIQMAGWLISEGDETNLGKLLAEDLLARKANNPDPQLQQPLVEFNPPVTTLPEFGHYLDKQDRDGWSQLRCSVDSGSALYSGMMAFFLRQEARHMRSGEQVIEWYLQGRQIPMELHLKMEWEWDAISYRLHGVPYGSSGALTQYQLSTKNPIYPLDGRYMGTKLRIPHPDGQNGYKTVEVGPNMNLEHLNGYSVSILRSVLQNNNRKRTKLLDRKQRKEMRDFLKKVTHYMPKEQREKFLDDPPIPTAALSWRPDHLALEQMDRWRHISGYWTDVFGYPIPSEAEYREYRKLVELTEEDRDRIRQITSKPGWMAEDCKPGDRKDIYRTGPIEPREGDTVLHQWTVGKKKTNRTYFTMPQALEKWRREQTAPKEDSAAVEGEDGLSALMSLHDDLVN